LGKPNGILTHRWIQHTVRLIDGYAGSRRKLRTAEADSPAKVKGWRHGR
jgi:hypothetical protein